MLAGGSVPAQAASLDNLLTEQLAAAIDEAPIPVIVTVAPGTKPKVFKWLVPYGVAIARDYTVLEAFAANLPPRAIRKLARDRNVISIASDDVVWSIRSATAATWPASSAAALPTFPEWRRT
jgi:hypothetical protein